jgi:hypothetical protein
MKRIINRKVYNTETATKITSWDNKLPDNSIHAIKETLYRTQKGSLLSAILGRRRDRLC